MHRTETLITVAAVLAATALACGVARAGGVEPGGAPDAGQAPNPLKDRLFGMGPVEREVYQRVYKGRIGSEEHWSRVARIPAKELRARPDFARWEIDPAEFARNLDRKKSDLADLRKSFYRRALKGPVDQALVARFDEAMAKNKWPEAMAKNHWFGHLPNWEDTWKVCFLHPDKGGDTRHAAACFMALRDAFRASIEKELKDHGFSKFSGLNVARAAAGMYMLADAWLETHPDFRAKEPDASRELARVMERLKKVTWLAWTDPSQNENMRAKTPLQTATFRYDGTYTGGNFGYRPVLECAIVCNDTRMFDIVKDVIEKSLSSKSGYFDLNERFWPDGIKTEGTLFAHGEQNYTFGYGKDYITFTLGMAERLFNSVWEIDNAKWDGIADVLLDGWQWYVHKGNIELSVLGRHSLYPPSSKDAGYYMCGNSHVLNWILPGVLRLSRGQLRRRAELDAMVERMRRNDDLVGNRYFWLSEDMLHHRKDQYVCVNMSSARVAGPEGYPWDTTYNRLFGCGLTVLKRDARDLLHLRGAWDYSALPGVTFAQGDAYAHPRQWSKLYGKNIYSGGVSDGRNGLCAFRYRQKGIRIAINKACFAFDNRFVCLGSELINPAKAEAWTTVNQCTAKGDVRVFVNGAGKTFPHGTPVNLREPSDKPIALWHDRMGYVVFPHNGKAEILLKVENRTTHWRDIINPKRFKDVTEYPVDVFQLSIPHDPADAAPNPGYRYAVLFNVSPEELARRLASGDIAILQNDARVQAVACGGYTGLVFLEEGAFRSERLELAVDRPAILMLDETEPGAVKLTYADPLLDPAAKELVVKTNLRLAGPAAEDGTVHLALPRTPEVGKPA
ncbi:MAG: hypothetical protein JXR37_03820, partial [Kiritimatiellae bacterium]|nr:hypothetical protein [Kiritimatiellia bacterium]